MKSGNWVALSKALLPELPKGRPFSEVEAAFSLQIDYDNGETVTVAGYAMLWTWDRGKVNRFLKKMGVVLAYPENTGKKQNQRAQIMLQNTHRSQPNNAQIRLVDSRCLRGETNRSETENEQIKLRSCSTTKEPNPKPLKDSSVLGEFFGKLWKAYPRKDGRKEAERHFHATVKNDVDMKRINYALAAYLDHIEREGTQQKYIKTGKVWFNNWQDWITEEESDAA